MRKVLEDGTLPLNEELFSLR
ncbi:protein of unknown function [[Clostridium] ultunense Esp]|uniref:Uncharacterized protein n=1 Tax=[Clostridium] ultunense Esp TaxID=1288971 RepID=A0A1M4PPD1_9FIRM|nr:protein of unknown function [[Clostridium] ultunense Esp]